MANQVLLKKSSVASKVPLVTDLAYGELALNYADGKLYYKNASNVIKSFLDESTVVTLSGTQTLTNKTLTSPTISGGSIDNATIGGTTPAAITGTTVTSTGNLVSTFSSGDEGGEIQLAKPQTNTTLAGSVSIDIYQNKLRFFENGGTNRGFYIDITTGTSSAGTNIISSGGGGATSMSIAGDTGSDSIVFATETLTFVGGVGLTSAVTSNTVTFDIDSTVATLTGTQTLTNKTISGASNTITNIGNSSLTNSSVTVNGTAISLGGSATITAANPNALTIGTGLSGTSYNGSSAVTIAIDSTVATLSGTQTLTNKTLTDSTTFFQDETDNTKKLQFQLSGITTATTRTLTVPDVSGTIITTGDTATVTNTMLAGSIANNKLANSSVTIGSTAISLGGTSTTLAGLSSVTSTSFVGALTGNASTATTLQTARNINGVSFDGSANITITANTTNALTIGTGLSGTSFNGSGAVTIAIDSTVATLTGTQTLTNKTLTDSTTFFQDETDNTKKLQLQLSGITTATTRTLTVPDISSTIAVTGNNLSVFASTTSAQLAGVISDETGSGALVFGTSPTITTSLVAGSATMALFNTTATTVNAFGAATTISLGAGTGTTTVNNDLVVSGNLTVNGTTTTINATTITVDDKNIELGSIASPTNTSADGGGITLKGTTDKTLNWVNATGSWTSSEDFDLATGKVYRINGTSVLSATALGSGVTSSSLTSVGTITTGTWSATNIALGKGGTNASLTAVNGGIVYSTASAMAITAAGTSGQALLSAGAAAPVWTTLSLTDLPDAWVKKSVRVATTASITLSGTQTIDGVAVVAGDRVLVKDQATASANGIYVVAAGAWSRAPDADTISKLAGALVNVDSGTVNGGLRYDTDLKATDTLDTTAVTFYKAYDTNDAASTNTASKLVLRDASGNFSAGTITAALTGNASTATTLQTARNINGVSFNGSANITITANTTNALTIGTGLSGTSFNGSSAVTIAIDSTVATLTGTQTLTNKTLSSAILTGTLTAGGGVGTNGQVLQSTGTGVQWASVGTGTVTSITAGTGLTGGTITSTGTIAIDTSVVATLTGSQTLTNKSLTSPTVTGTVNNNSILYDATFSGTTSGTTPTAIHTFAIATYRSAEYTFQITNGTFYKLVKVLVLHDGTNVTIGGNYLDATEVQTGTQNTTYTFDINTGNLRLMVTAASGTATVKGMARMIAV